MIQYFRLDDEAGFLATGTPFDDDVNSWWAGVQKCAAAVLLAATLAVSASQTAQATNQTSGWNHQDDPAGNLFGQDDEDFWSNPTVPIPPSVYQSLPYLPDAQIDPAGNLFGQDDEDFWSNPVAPVPATLGKLYLPDPEEIPAGNLVGMADDDSWQNLVTSVPANFGKIYNPDPEEIPSGSLLLGEPDEDFWQNPVFPVPAVFYQALPYTPDPEELALLQLAADEDYWYRTLRIYVSGISRVSSGGATLTTFDEDFWVSGVAPVPATLGKLYLPDPEEIPGVFALGQPDEDFWVNPAAPVAATFYQRLPYLPDPEELIVPQPPILNIDEDIWQNFVNPVPGYPVPRVFVDEDLTIPSVPLAQVDEDFYIPPFTLSDTVLWKIVIYLDEGSGIPTFLPEEDSWQSLTAPIFTTFYQPLPYLPDPEELVFVRLDEDSWQNFVAPLSATFYQPLPYLPDPEELSVTPLAQPDEDFWVNGVAPVFAVFGKIYNPDPEELSATSLVGKPDEDFWVNGVAPVSATFGKLYLLDPEELTASTLFGQPEEDFWQNFVVPIPTTFGKLYLLDPEELPVASFFGQADEDYWQNPVAPVIPNSVAGVVARYFQPTLLTDDDVAINFQIPGVGVNVIAADMFSVVQIAVLAGRPLANVIGSDFIDTNICPAISLLVNYINQTIYPDSYRLAAATTLLLQNSVLKTIFIGGTSYIDSLISQNSANSPSFAGFIAQARAILAAT